jgi:hypothetical protein
MIEPAVDDAHDILRPGVEPQEIAGLAGRSPVDLRKDRPVKGRQ